MCFWKKKPIAGSVTEFMEDFYGSADKSVLHGRIEGTYVDILYEEYHKFCEKKDAKVLSLRKFVENVKTEYVLDVEMITVQHESNEKMVSKSKFIERE